MKRQLHSVFPFAVAAAMVVAAGCLRFGAVPSGAPAAAPAAALAHYRAAVDPATLAGVTAERFPDADSVAVFQWEQTRYEADGTYETEWSSIDKILTERGLEKSKSMTLSNNDFYGSLTVLVARVHSPDGPPRDVDLASNLAEAVDTSSLSSNIHDPNDKTFVLAFPGLRVGDAVETRMRRTVRKPRVEGVYADWLAFEQTDPVLWQGASIDGPLEKPFLSRAFRDGGPVLPFHLAETNLAAGRIVETWTAGEVPRYFSEPDMPPGYECTARVLLSTAEDWESLSRWYAKLCAPHLAATNAAMARKVAELAAAAGGVNGPDASRGAVVRALFDFVSREVRYMGAMAESEAPGYEPHDVSLTFANRYGVCRDKAALLAAMLRMAGIEAWPALVHVGEKKDPDVPQPWFNHAIVAADSGDPSDPYVLMDPTSETTRSLLPEYLCEKSYLVARDGGETIRETPPLPVEDNLVEADTVVSFAPGGPAACESQIRFGGINDAAYRRHFASMQADGVRAFCQRLLLGAAPGAVLTGWSLSPDHSALLSDLAPLSLHLSCEIPDALRTLDAGGGPAAGERKFPFDPPRFAETVAIASRVLGNLGLEKRRFPLVTEFPCGFTERIRFEGAVPEPFAPVKFESGAVSCEDSLDGSVLLRSLRLRRSRYSPEEYASLRSLREAEQRADRSPLFLSPVASDVVPAPDGEDGGGAPARLSAALAKAVRPEPEDDTFLERSHTVVDLSDMPRSWTVTSERREKILSYAGRRKASDVSFSWNPAVAEFELLDARTIAPDGTETPVDPALDVFDGDQSWVAGAPRYPAGRIKTVSFPKTGPGSTVSVKVRRRTFGFDFFSFARTLGRLGSFGEDAVEVVGPGEWRRAFFLREPDWPGLAGTNAVERADSEGATAWKLRGGGPGSAVAPESGMPELRRLFPSVEACAQDAGDRACAIRDAFFALSDPAVETNAAALARSLAAADAPAAEKVRAIRDWTDLNLRSAGPAWTSLPLSFLSGADETLAARYGHAADRRILQLAMARALGLEVRLRFHSSRWDVPSAGPGRRKTPSAEMAGPQDLDEVSVVVSSGTDGGPDLFLDGASRFAPLPFERNADRPRLELKGREGRMAVLERPVSPPRFDPLDEAADSTERRLLVSLRPDGSAAVDVTVRYHGAEAASFRRKYSQMVPEERRRDAQKLAASISQSARLAGEVVASHPPEGPCTLAFSVEVPDLAVARGGGFVMRLSRAELFPEVSPRVFPFDRNSTRRERTVTDLRLPAGWRIDAAPADGGVWIDPEFGIFLSRSVVRDPEPGVALRVADTSCIGPAEFPPERYPEFLAGELATRGASADTVAVAPVGP